jgi:hypothetical protein
MQSGVAGASGGGGGSAGGPIVDPRVPFACADTPPNAVQCSVVCAGGAVQQFNCPPNNPPSGLDTFTTVGGYPVGTTVVIGAKSDATSGACGAKPYAIRVGKVSGGPFRATVTAPWLIAAFVDGNLDCQPSQWCLLGTTGGFVIYIPDGTPPEQIGPALVVIDKGTTCEGVVP